MVKQNIVLIGPMGAGKTSIGKSLAKAINWDFYDSDQVIEKRAGVEVLWIYDVEGVDGFHKREEKIIADLMQKRNIVLATGGSTVVVAKNREIISKYGLVIYLYTSLDEQLIRTGYNKKRPLSSELEERRNMLSYLHKEYVPLYENLADITYRTTQKATKRVIAELVELIKEHNSNFGIMAR